MASEKKLTAHDRILWGKVARTTRPLAGKMEMLEELQAQFQIAEENEQSGTTKAISPQDARANERTDDGLRSTRTRQHHPLERPVKRKLAKGRLPIEARIDLHGLFQSEAHGMLLGFLMRAHERGLRHVLVITGKGSSMGSEGALKRAVPLWLAKPEFRHLVSSFEESAQVHGGGGALYVRLARTRADTA